jgi:polysaccharide biosynthesis/export protein
MLRVILLILATSLAGCAYFYPKAPPTVAATAGVKPTEYIISAGDTLDVFVWHNSDLSISAPVRPDGRISVPLLGDVLAAGLTPTQLGDSIEADLSRFVQKPVVTIIVRTTGGVSNNNVRVIGEAVQPRVVPYYVGITLMDVVANVGGLTTFADGNRAYLIRSVDGKPKKFRLRIGSLIRGGDMTANVQLAPNDTIVIPQRWY